MIWGPERLSYITGVQFWLRVTISISAMDLSSKNEVLEYYKWQALLWAKASQMGPDQVSLN